MKEKLPIRIIHYASVYLMPTRTGNLETIVTTLVMMIVLGGFAAWFYKLGGGVIFWLFFGLFLLMAFSVLIELYFWVSEFFTKDERGSSGEIEQ